MNEHICVTPGEHRDIAPTNKEDSRKIPAVVELSKISYIEKNEKQEDSNG